MYGSHVAGALTISARKRVIDASIAFLTPRSAEYDAIAMRGASGLLIAPVLCSLLDKVPILIRKPDEKPRHDGREVDACVDHPAVCRWILCDDFISSGRTVKAAIEAMRAVEFPDPVAIFLWSRCGGAGLKTYRGTQFNVWAGGYGEHIKFD